METTTLHVPLSDIHVQPDFNPRRHFEPGAFERLCESIRDNGLVQPVAIRRRDEGGYWLISGERRVRAMTKLGRAEIPALLHECDEPQARAMALVENLDRANIGPAEEAQAFRALLDHYAGDRDLAAKHLGWNASKTASRLALLQASQAVLDALARDEINIGHAELLASLPAENQDKALPRIIEQKVSVTQLREELEKFSIPLADAIFDRAGCQGCPHNSSTQRELFTEVVSEGRCTNKPCFVQKTNARLSEQRVELREQYATVALRSEKLPGTTIPLAKHGPCGVGETQFSACRACPHFGAILNDKLGRDLGTVEAPTCFDLACHKERVAEHQQANADADAPDGDDASDSASRSTATTSRTSPKKAAPKAKASVPKGKTPGHPTAVLDRDRATLARAVGDAATRNPNITLALALVALGVLESRSNRGGKSAADLLRDLTGIKVSGTDKRNERAVTALVTQDKAKLREYVVAATTRILSGTDPRFGNDSDGVSRATLNPMLAAVLGIEVAPYVRIDADYLDAMTTGAIEALLEESGFKRWMTEQPDGAARYKRLVAQRKGDFIKGVLAAGFDFAGYIPTSLKSLLKGAPKT